MELALDWEGFGPNRLAFFSRTLSRNSCGLAVKIISTPKWQGADFISMPAPTAMSSTRVVTKSSYSSLERPYVRTQRAPFQRAISPTVGVAGFVYELTKLRIAVRGSSPNHFFAVTT